MTYTVHFTIPTTTKEIVVPFKIYHPDQLQKLRGLVCHNENWQVPTTIKNNDGQTVTLKEVYNHVNQLLRS